MGRSESMRFYHLNVPSLPTERKDAPPIMVFDSCSLFRLAQPIPEKMFRADFPKEKRPHCYLDLLRLLPKDVLSAFYVPDIVVFESVGYAPTGEIIKKQLLCDRINSGIEEKHPISCHHLKSILGIGERTKVENIQIIHDPRSQAYFRAIAPYYDRVEQTKNNLNNGIRHSSSQRSSNYSPVLHNRCHELHLKKLELGADWGEIVGAEFALSYAITHRTNVTFISEDDGGRNLIVQNRLKHPSRDKISCAAMNISRLMTDLKERGVLEQAGFREGVLVETMVEKMREYATNERDATSEVHTHGRQHQGYINGKSANRGATP